MDSRTRKSSSTPTTTCFATLAATEDVSKLDHKGEGRRRLFHVSLCRRISAGDSEFVGHSDKLRQRSRAHLSHDLSPMNPDCVLGNAKVAGSLFVSEAGDHKGKYLPLT